MNYALLAAGAIATLAGLLVSEILRNLIIEESRARLEKLPFAIPSPRLSSSTRTH